jgi:hypothetical protein
VAVVRVDVRVRLGRRLRGAQRVVRQLLADRREQSEGERRQAQQPEHEEKGEKSELANAPAFRRAGLSPERRQDAR